MFLYKIFTLPGKVEVNFQIHRACARGAARQPGSEPRTPGTGSLHMDIRPQERHDSKNPKRRAKRKFYDGLVSQACLLNIYTYI